MDVKDISLNLFQLNQEERHNMTATNRAIFYAFETIRAETSMSARQQNVGVREIPADSAIKIAFPKKSLS